MVHEPVRLLPLLLHLLMKVHSLFSTDRLSFCSSNLGWCIKLTVWLTAPAKHRFGPVAVSIMHGNFLEYLSLALGPYTHADSVANGIIVEIGGRVA